MTEESSERRVSAEGPYTAPFGRYENTHATEWSANEFLVGRESQRRRLLNLMLTHGKRSAYLITGQRGSGKTAFVDYCLEEYKQDVYGRFLKSGVGRSFYDRVGLAVVVGLLGILAFTFKGLLRFVWYDWSPAPNENFRWVLGAPIFIFLLYPVIAARSLLDVATDTRVDARAKESAGKALHKLSDLIYDWRGKLLVLLLVGVLALFTWIRGRPLPAAPFLSFMFVVTVIAGHLCAWRPREADPKRSLARAARYMRPAAALLTFMTLFVGYLPVWRKIRWVSDWYAGGSHATTYICLIAATVGTLLDLVGSRFFGRPSRLGDWVGEENRAPWFARQRVILSIKAIALLGSSAIITVDVTSAVAGGVGRGSSESLGAELGLLALLILLFVSIARLEFNWIIRPHLRVKSGIALDKRRLDEKCANLENYMRRLDGHSSFAFLYAWWLPMLFVRVNLGVEALDHRRVIEAMLAGLRDAYERTFLHWRSPLANAGRALRLMVLITVTTLVGDHFFASNVDESRLCDQSCDYRPRINALVCLVGEPGDSFARALQFDLLSSRAATTFWPERCDEAGGDRSPRKTKRLHIAHVILPTSVGAFDESFTGGNPGEFYQVKIVYRHVIDIRLYHVFIFLVLLVVARLLERKWPVFAYRTTLRDINDALASLSSTLTQERGLELKLGGETLALGGKRGRITDPMDPRTVELLFLRLLRQIDEAALLLPFVAGAHVSVPVPDIFFVFDELDKLGVHKLREVPSPGSEKGPAITIEEERARSLLLRSLFSDLKNILSSAPARFIFVGGRNLHDEWLADQTSRQPLLTRLFAGEIYVPSLLTDRPDQSDRLTDGVEAFLKAQMLRAKTLYESWIMARQLRWLRHKPREPVMPSFVTARDIELGPMPSFTRIGGKSCLGSFRRDFVAFLTYRSMGNVKRLKELIEGFLEQVSEGSVEGSHTHALVLRGGDIHRVQLIADIYHGLLRVFGGPIWRDDKLAPAVFYLADFLLKFHRRAFTWGNLERVDELVHVHRAPELRKLVHAIVDVWTGTLLHPIRNGMFDFRFRIEIAHELRLASRRSDEEMAALNFTLDEAQELKELYRRRLAATTDPAAFEFEAALGELHDLDEEFDLARYRYRRAVHHLDEQIARDLIGAYPTQALDAREASILNRVLMRDADTLVVIQRRGHWAVTRLRYMLQIALTHERTRDYEGAVLEYRNARALAEALLASGRAADLPAETRTESYELFKHVSLLFQPAFAEAWVGEKAGTLLDGSVAIVERSLDMGRRELPFVRRPFGNRPGAKNPTKVHHSLFALIFAELHDKAGDLLFFKGKPKGADVAAFRGYIDRAHFHYARSLHEIRSYNLYRIESSGAKLGFDSTVKTLVHAAVPDFVLQIAAGSLADLGEALLAGTSLNETLSSEGAKIADASKMNVIGERTPQGWTGAVPRMIEAVLAWLQGKETSDFGIAWSTVFGDMSGGDLTLWLGDVSPQAEKAPEGFPMDPVFAASGRRGRAQFVMSLILSLAAARALKQDGRLEDAASESLMVAETVARWFLASRYTSKLVQSCDEGVDEWCTLLAWISIYSVEKAQLWWRLSRRASEKQARAVVNGGEFVEAGDASGILIPRAVERILAVLDAFCRGPATGNCAKDVHEHIGTLIGVDKDSKTLLRESVECNAYPMTHQLYGLKILIDLRTLDLVDGSPNRQDLENWWSDVESLIRADAEYAGRQRFSHSDIGLTLGLACHVATRNRTHWSRSDSAGIKLSEARIAQVRSDAIEHLDQAEESFTLRRSYQEWIADLYYLYDDFNDRRLHYNRAAEMAVSELIALLLQTLRSEARPPVRGSSASPP